MKYVVIVVVVLAVIGGGVFALTRKSKTNNPTTSNSTPATSSSNQTSDTSQPSASVATITYSDSGFSPSTITVKAGSTITIKNTSSGGLQFESDPHPVHTDDTELNVGTVASGQSMTFTVAEKGTHGYHNHLNPSDTGTIIVE